LYLLLSEGPDKVGREERKEGLMRSIELFAGGGGLLLGCALAGFSHEIAVEWDANSCDTLCLNVERSYPLLEGHE
jgi:site-specific DNA-cytosine methylase